MTLRRRSVFADRLHEFPSLVFSDGAEFNLRGAWRDHFRQRIGASFDDRLIFDIGCADASLIEALAARHPATAFIGIDWKCRGLHGAAERIRAAGLHNIALLHGRAQDIRKIFAASELDEIWLLHPEPCDQPKELPNRLFTEPFLLDAHATLANDGRFVLKTDHAGYYQWALALFGLPEPQAFERARSEPFLAARIRLDELHPAGALPGASATLCSAVEVAIRSEDFWEDTATQAAVATRLFAEHTTSYESRFRRKRWPIYYLELMKRRPCCDV